MRISVVQETSDNLILQFMPYGSKQQRLWIRNPEQRFQTIGRWCPHININGLECDDCALNVE